MNVSKVMIFRNYCVERLFQPLDPLIDQYNRLEQPVAVVLLDSVDQNGNYIDVENPVLEMIPNLSDLDLLDILGPDDHPPPLLPLINHVNDDSDADGVRAYTVNVLREIKDCLVIGFAQIVFNEILNHLIDCSVN